MKDNGGESIMDGVWGELEEIDGEGVECSNIGGLEETGCIFFAFL